MNTIIAGFRSNNKNRKIIASIYYAMIILSFIFSDPWQKDDFCAALFMLLTPTIILNFKYLLNKNIYRQKVLCVLAIYILTIYFSPDDSSNNIATIESNSQHTETIKINEYEDLHLDFSKNRDKVVEFLVSVGQGDYEKKYIEAKNSSMFSSSKEFKITLDNKDGIYYYGELKDNKPNEIGILVFSTNNEYYVGEFKEGKPNGFGILSTGSEFFEGEFKDGRMNGKGNEFNDNNFAINNEFKIESSLPDYTGKFKDGKYDSKGTLYYETGKVLYEGDIKSGKYDGKGTLYYEDGKVKYKGEFEKGKYDGKGSLYNENGELKYKGKFKKGDIA